MPKTYRVVRSYVLTETVAVEAASPTAALTLAYAHQDWERLGEGTHCITIVDERGDIVLHIPRREAEPHPRVLS